MAGPLLATAELVGRGYCSDVYGWGAGRVLKLFHAGTPRDDAERELAATRHVHAAGVPAPAAFEVIEVAGRPGIVFERLDGPSLVGHVQARPWTLLGAARLLADLHGEIHRRRAPAGLPTLKGRLAARVEASALPETDKTEALRQLAALPDGEALCHGDFHPGNVLLTKRGPVVIDWSSAGRGEPAGDVAWTLRLMRTASLPPWSPSYMHLLLRCSRPLLHRRYLGRYLRLRPAARGQIWPWERLIAAATSRRGRPTSV